MHKGHKDGEAMEGLGEIKKGEDGKGEGKGGVEAREEEEEEVPSGHFVHTGHQEVPENNWLPDQKIPFMRWVREITKE